MEKHPDKTSLKELMQCLDLLQDKIKELDTQREDYVKNLDSVKQTLILRLSNILDSSNFKIKVRGQYPFIISGYHAMLLLNPRIPGYEAYDIQDIELTNIPLRELKEPDKGLEQ